MTFCQPVLLPRLNHIKSTYVIAEWNCNGWFTNKSPYILEFKQNVIKFLNADCLILPETHCLPHQKIEIENYTLFHNKRSNIPANCKRGSGGIAIAIKDDLLIDHEIVAVYNYNIDGQIGLK